MNTNTDITVFIVGFVTPIILEKYSHRKTAIVSGILMGGGLALTFVVDHIAIFYAGFAVAGKDKNESMKSVEIRIPGETIT